MHTAGCFSSLLTLMLRKIFAFVFSFDCIEENAYFGEGETGLCLLSRRYLVFIQILQGISPTLVGYECSVERTCKHLFSGNVMLVLILSLKKKKLLKLLSDFDDDRGEGGRRGRGKNCFFLISLRMANFLFND